MKDWSEYVPAHVGIIVGQSLVSKKQSALQDMADEYSMILRESLIRSFWWKREKEYDAQNIEKKKSLEKDLRVAKKELDSWKERAYRAESIIEDYEFYHAANQGLESFCLQHEVKREQQLYDQSVKGSVTNV